MADLTLKPGIHEGIPLKSYLSLPCFSKSMVTHLSKSPKHLRHYLDHPEYYETNGMALGNLADTLLFEPDQFSARYWEIPPTYTNSQKEIAPWTKASKTCRAAEDAAVAQGLKLARRDDVETARIIVQNIRNHPLASKWLAEGKFQTTLIWQDPMTEVMCKGRPDIWLPERIVDLKLTQSASPAAFSRIINQFQYHVQASMYHDGRIFLETGKYPVDVQLPFSFIVAEYEPPYDVVCYTLDMEAILCGRELFKQYVQVYADCCRMNQWPGYSNFDEMIGIPAWAERKIMMEGATS